MILQHGDHSEPRAIAHEDERRGEQRDIHDGDQPAAARRRRIGLRREQQRHGGGEADAEPPRRRQLLPRDHGEEADAGKAAEQVQRVAAGGGIAAISLPIRCAIVANSAATMMKTSGSSIVLSTTTRGFTVPLVK